MELHGYENKSSPVKSPNMVMLNLFQHPIVLCHLGIPIVPQTTFFLPLSSIPPPPLLNLSSTSGSRKPGSPFQQGHLGIANRNAASHTIKKEVVLKGRLRVMLSGVEAFSKQESYFDSTQCDADCTFETASSKQNGLLFRLHHPLRINGNSVSNNRVRVNAARQIRSINIQLSFSFFIYLDFFQNASFIIRENNFYIF
jgi:hypothetical protein